MISAKAPPSKKKYVSRKLSSKKHKTITPCEHRSPWTCNAHKHIDTCYHRLQGLTLATGATKSSRWHLPEFCCKATSKKS